MTTEQPTFETPFQECAQDEDELAANSENTCTDGNINCEFCPRENCKFDDSYHLQDFAETSDSPDF